MYERRAVRRSGVWLVGANVIGAGAYVAGSSAAKHSEQEVAQHQKFAQLQTQQPAPQQGQSYAPITPPQQGQSFSLTDEKMEHLRKLGELKKEGLLSYAEFEAQKQRLLS
jgi:hypothetical protein